MGSSCQVRSRLNELVCSDTFLAGDDCRDHRAFCGWSGVRRVAGAPSIARSNYRRNNYFSAVGASPKRHRIFSAADLGTWQSDSRMVSRATALYLAVGGDCLGRGRVAVDGPVGTRGYSQRGSGPGKCGADTRLFRVGGAMVGGSVELEGK